MTIQVHLAGFLGIALADIDLGPIALVVGQNAEGKSSLVEGMAAALCGAPLVRGIKAKKDLALAVHDGYREGDCTVFTDTDSQRVSWPEGTLSSTGKGIYASRIATGLDRFCHMPEADKIQTLAQIYDATVTSADVMKELVDIGFSEKARANIVARVQRGGLDEAHDHYRDDRTRAKGAWEGITGERYGSAKAGMWEPVDWTPSLARETPEALRATVEAAQGRLEALTGDVAVSADRRARLQAEAGKLEDLRTMDRKLQEGLSRAQKAQDDAQFSFDALPEPVDWPIRDCPKCGASLCVVSERHDALGPRLIEPSEEMAGITQEQAQERALARAQGKSHLEHMTQNRYQAERYIAASHGAIESAEAAHKELAGLPPEAEAGEDADEARQAMTSAMHRQEIHRKKGEANVIHARIGMFDKLVVILGPKGLRATKQAATIGEFNRDLSDMAAAFSLAEELMLDAEWQVRLGDRPFGLLSAGMQFAVEALIRLTIAVKDKSALVLIDGAEVLAGENRKKLLAAVISTKLPAVIAMAVSRAGQVPNLKALDAGKTYWVEDGEVTEI